jgi:hypothetical protein
MFWCQEFSTSGNNVLFQLFLDYSTPTSPLHVKGMCKANLPNMVNQLELKVCHLTLLLSKLVLFLSFWCQLQLKVLLKCHISALIHQIAFVMCAVNTQISQTVCNAPSKESI